MQLSGRRLGGGRQPHATARTPGHLLGYTPPSHGLIMMIIVLITSFSTIFLVCPYFRKSFCTELHVNTFQSIHGVLPPTVYDIEISQPYTSLSISTSTTQVLTRFSRCTEHVPGTARELMVHEGNRRMSRCRHSRHHPFMQAPGAVPLESDPAKSSQTARTMATKSALELAKAQPLTVRKK
jgi:hypothetical protein